MGDSNINGFRPKTTKKKITFRSGILTLTQKELKHEIEKIELARRQYRNAHAREQRKTITRLAFKLIRSSSDLDHLNFNKNSSSMSYTSTSQNSVQNYNEADLNDTDAYQDVYLENKENASSQFARFSPLKREKTFSGNYIDHFGLKSAHSDSRQVQSSMNTVRRSSSLKGTLRLTREDTSSTMLG